MVAVDGCAISRGVTQLVGNRANGARFKQDFHRDEVAPTRSKM